MRSTLTILAYLAAGLAVSLLVAWTAPAWGRLRPPAGPVSRISGVLHSERVGAALSERHEADPPAQGPQGARIRVVIREGWPARCVMKESFPYERELWPPGTVLDVIGVSHDDGPTPERRPRGGLGPFNSPLSARIAVVPIWPGLAADTAFWALVAFATVRTCRCAVVACLRSLTREPEACKCCGYSLAAHPHNGRCPECGAAFSHRRRRLHP